MTTDDDQWDDPARLESNSDGSSDVSAPGFTAGVVAVATLLYFLWVGAHTEAVLSLWAIVALGIVGMLLGGLRGER